LACQGDGADALTEAGSLIGTPAYMAPEQLDGKPASAQSDLFGLGAVFYECATGQRAFVGPTITAILKAVSEHHPASPETVNPEVPATLSALILRLLAKNPSDRPATVAEVHAALSASGSDRTELWVDPMAHSHPKRRNGLWIAAGIAFVAMVATSTWLMTHPPGPAVVTEMPSPTPPQPVPSPSRYQGKVDVLVERVVEGKPVRLRVNQTGALPLRQNDKFRIEGQVEPPAYLYVVWVDPDHDLTPVYPWNPTVGHGAWATRPKSEEKTNRVSLPPNAAKWYTAPAAKPGVATIVLFACSTPLEGPDERVEKWFKELPELPLPSGGNGVAIWFDDYLETHDPNRLRTFGVVDSDDAFARWQGQLQKALGGNANYQTAVSFARTGGQ